MSGGKPARRQNEAFRVSMPFKILWLAVSFSGGALCAAALPPLNWNFAAFFVLLPLLWAGIHFRWGFRLLCGWVWGLGWVVFAYNFLREIHPAVPYLLAPVLALWPAVFTLTLGFFTGLLFDRRSFSVMRRPEVPAARSVCYTLTAAALFTVLEWTRCRLFVWNDLSVTMWKLPLFMQISRLTGRYGVSFFVTCVNSAVFALLFFRRPAIPALSATCYPLLVCLYGFFALHRPETEGPAVKWRCALVQGDLPQQRAASADGIRNAVEVYTEASRKLLADSPMTVIWPECAVPVPLRGSSGASAFYRSRLAGIGCQLLIGTLDFNDAGELTNSAVLISPEGRITGKYDKFHRVPFGEYVPFRTLLPEFLIRRFDMGRDLAPGEEIAPLVISPDIRAGTAVCYEGVFSYLAAGFARRGANVLAAVSNDVWYPRSSEPEQHLANAVMRCVETGLPMIRCGNNGGSGVVTPRGEFVQYIGTPSARPELLREKAAGIVEVTLSKQPPLTPAVRYENLLAHLLLLGLIAEAALFACLPRR